MLKDLNNATHYFMCLESEKLHVKLAKNNIKI
jgi:hypothetical protein